jgi:hypothetical protein
MVENSQDDGIDRGEIRTVFSATHAAIKATGVKMCTDHKWKKVNEVELACTVCPTQIICSIDDERLVNTS